MSQSHTWTASKSGTGRTELIKLFQNSEQLTFSALFGLLRDDQEFADWYTELLKQSPYTSYFWEHPPLTLSRLSHGAEFAMIDAPMLDNMRPNAEAFRSYFAGGEIVTFQNLGGDATLVAPSPDDSAHTYPHLGAFLQQAPARKIRELWRCVGRAVCDGLSEEPIWLSTSGLGIAWLHIRLDSFPKYYQHQPYKHLPVADNEE